MRRVYPLLLLAALLALLLSGCGTSSANGGASDVSVTAPGTPAVSAPSSDPAATNSAGPQQNGSSTEPISGSTAPDAGPEAQLKQSAKDIIDVLRDRDLERLAAAIDPKQGLRLSPYSHIDAKAGRVFKPGELPTFKDSTKLTWGSYDGSGEPIELTFRDYFEKFVYDQDYAGAPNITVNKVLGSGNMKFNGQEVYPDASFVEYQFPGFDTKKDGMDWESLVLIFRPSGSDWKLCAIVHGQWTI